MSTAYIYRHIRLDKNEPFYIGIGRTANYSRAYNKKERSNQWKGIAKNGYEVEILLDDLSWDEACEKEKEFIKLYGRIDKKNGTLINFTDGGEGVINYVYTDETREKISIAQKGNQNWKHRKPSDEWKGKISESNKGKKRSQEFKEKMSKMRKGNNNPNFGKKLSEEHKEKIKKTRKSKPIIQFDLSGNFIKEWSSKKECMRNGYNELGVWGCCNNTRKTHRGYIWKYKN